MFIRKKVNRSGSVSVQILEKINRRNRLLKSVGVGKTPHEVELLVRIARFEMDKLKSQPSLFNSSEDVAIDAFMAGIYNEDIRLVGPHLVFGSLFRSIGFNKVLEDTSYLEALVVSRLVMPGSKMRTVEYLHRHSKITVGVHAIYKYMDKLTDAVIDRVQTITFKHTKDVLAGQVGIVFYDMTTLYFEIDREDDLRKVGYSKDGKHQHPQIMIGLLVSTNGYPIAYQIFEGNTAETKTLIPAIQSICDRYKIRKPIVVADAALLSKSNLKDLESNGFEYILGGRIKSEDAIIKNKILLTKITEEHPVEFKTQKGRLVVSFSSKRQRKDAFNRNRGLERLKKKVATGKLTKESINNRGYNKYLTLKGETTVQIDYHKFHADAKWDGLKGYNTNTNLSPKEVISAYSNLWVVEKAFRISKSDLKTRPVYHRKHRRITAHICICFIAYTLYKELERRLKVNHTGITIENAVLLISDILEITYTQPVSRQKKSKLLKLTGDKALIIQIAQK
jgi:transposase